ncbi:MAG: nicotinate-nucleotide adenylyltransferase [Chloroflexi bacterium]|nr:nicotinate-nucleotide adenylyltransferase [Chloroflexota bacterium]
MVPLSHHEVKIGIYGGTFDPIHNAHLTVAEEVRTRLELREVLFIPAGQPLLRPSNYVSPARHRLEMVRLAIAGKPYFKVSAMEIERPGATFTVDTLAELKAGQYQQNELFVILGWDSFLQLPYWREPARIIQLCVLVVVPRPGYPPPDIKRMEANLPGLSQRVMLLQQPQMDISASEIRQRVAQGLSISYLVPPPVEKYVREHRLYLSQ